MIERKMLNKISMKFSKLGLYTLLLIFFTTTTAACQSDSEDVAWLIDVLELSESSIVADVGAGDGDLSIALAKHVTSGKVYSSELGTSRVERLRRNIESASVSNVTVIEGDPRVTNLPEACCNALFVRNVYHHFDDPASMNRSIWKSLKPGGRIAVIDFEPRGSESDDPEGRDEGDRHGVTVNTVVEELRQAGFRLISSEEKQSNRDIYVVMEKPREE